MPSAANEAPITPVRRSPAAPEITTFSTNKTTRGKRIAATAFVEILEHPTEYAHKDLMPLYSGARFTGNSRASGSRVVEFGAIVVEHDAGKLATNSRPMSIDEALQRLQQTGIAAWIYTTPSHTPEAPRWRVIAPLSAAAAPSEHAALVETLNGLLDGTLAAESRDPARCWYYGRCATAAEYRCLRSNGEPLDLAMLFNDLPGAPLPAGRSASTAQGTSGAPPAQRAPRAPADFFGRVNDAAMQSLGAWVPALLPGAQPYHDGYRVKQADLRRPDLEEDLSIVPAGIVDFGVHDMGDERAGKRTPIDLVMEWAHLTMDDLEITRPIDAALWLCKQLDVDPADLGFGLRHPHGGDAYRGILDHIEQAPVDTDTAALAQEAIQQTARAPLDHIQTAAILQRLRKRTGLPIRVLRTQLQAARTSGDDENGTHHAYALDFIEHLTERSDGQRPVGPEGRIFTFNNGIWTGREPDEYAGEVATRYDGRPRCERRSDYQAIPRHAHDIVRPGTEAFFEHSPVGVAAGPWFYRIDGGRLVHERLSPEHRVRYALPFEPAAAPATAFNAFLAETFASPTPGEAEEQIGLLQEIAGAIVTGTMARHQKVVLFKGDGRAGKGTVQRILEELVPDAFRSATSPFTWDGEYYLAKLAGRRLNIVGELPDDKYIPAATFKTVTGGDLLEGRHPSGRPFSFRNSAAHVFSSNHFINTNDVTDAFFARWLILEFPNSRLTLSADQIDAGLADRIIGTEMPAILDWALRGAIRLAERGHFKTTRTHDRLMLKWRARASSLLEFIQDESACELGEHFNVPRAQFFARYREHCANTGRKPIAKAKLYEELTSPAVAALGVHVTPRTSAQRERVAGLRLVDGLDPFE